jgi:hypothetical protein
MESNLQIGEGSSDVELVSESRMYRVKGDKEALNLQEKKRNTILESAASETFSGLHSTCSKYDSVGSKTPNNAAGATEVHKTAPSSRIPRRSSSKIDIRECRSFSDPTKDAMSLQLPDDAVTQVGESDLIFAEIRKLEDKLKTLEAKVPVASGSQPRTITSNAPIPAEVSTDNTAHNDAHGGEASREDVKTPASARAPTSRYKPLRMLRAPSAAATAVNRTSTSTRQSATYHTSTRQRQTIGQTMYHKSVRERQTLEQTK